MGARECLRNGPVDYRLLRDMGRPGKLQGPTASFPNLHLAFCFLRPSGTCHTLYIEYNSLCALALSVEQLYCESSFFFSHADQLGIFIICSRIPPSPLIATNSQ